jgi:4-hydroxythreonine-4-phosphate dehydrogenase
MRRWLGGLHKKNTFMSGIDIKRTRPRVGITLGDINGIGPEVVLKCLLDPRILKFVNPIIIGSAHALEVHARKLGFTDLSFHVVRHINEVETASSTQTNKDIVVLDTALGKKPPIHFGQVTEMAGKVSMRAVEIATDLCTNGNIDAFVTAPISKEAISRAGYKIAGHTEFIAKRIACETYTMMMVADGLRIGLVTTHLPLSQIPKHITQEAILGKIKIISQSLQQDFGIVRPKIAVLSLNPHAGDGGVIGNEEIDIIAPAIAQANQAECLVFGPFPADGFFATRSDQRYDAVLAMYHDQGLVPFKTISFNMGTNFTAGLPIIRTSPDHGTAYDIAGNGVATPQSMRNAIYLAIDIARRREKKNITKHEAA